MGPRGCFYPYLYILHILDCFGQDMQVLYLGRAPRTKETLPDFLKWRRVTRPPLVFRGLTGSQRTPGFWGVTFLLSLQVHLYFMITLQIFVVIFLFFFTLLLITVQVYRNKTEFQIGIIV